MARPTLFTPELAAEIIDRIEKGQSLRFICDDDHIPSRETIRTWIRDNEEFSAQYARAKEEYADSMFEEMLEISDDGRNDWVERETAKGAYIALNEEALGRSRLRVDTRKWILARLAPKKYGEKSTQEITGADGGPMQIESTRSEAEKAEFMAMLAKARAE